MPVLPRPIPRAARWGGAVRPDENSPASGKFVGSRSAVPLGFRSTASLAHLSGLPRFRPLPLCLGRHPPTALAAAPAQASPPPTPWPPPGLASSPTICGRASKREGSPCAQPPREGRKRSPVDMETPLRPLRSPSRSRRHGDCPLRSALPWEGVPTTTSDRATLS